ncbi:hypothetical protein SRHO_G00020200 [Serrasalmus rhombeus]
MLTRFTLWTLLADLAKAANTSRLIDRAQRPLTGRGKEVQRDRIGLLSSNALFLYRDLERSVVLNVEMQKLWESVYKKI